MTSRLTRSDYDYCCTKPESTMPHQNKPQLANQHLSGSNMQRSDFDQNGVYQGPHPRSRSMTIRRPQKYHAPQTSTFFSPRTGDVIGGRSSCQFYKRPLLIGTTPSPSLLASTPEGVTRVHGIGSWWPRWGISILILSTVCAPFTALPLHILQNWRYFELLL